MKKSEIRNYSFISLCGGGGNRNVPAELSKLLQKPPNVFCELKITDLLPAGKKDKTMYVSKYRVGVEEIEQFNSTIDTFLGDLLQEEKKVP